MTDISRLEGKVDTLTAAINKLVLVEERQTVQSASIASLTTRITSTEQKLDMWINRGIGFWSLVITLFAAYKTFGNL